jgi:hypothetical protein
VPIWPVGVPVLGEEVRQQVGIWGIDSMVGFTAAFGLEVSGYQGTYSDIVDLLPVLR